jgi:hypothetical protein
MWANHSHDERAADLRQHLSQRRAERRRERRLQVRDELSEQGMDSSVVDVLDPAGALCDDALATNVGQAPPCAYDCGTLRDAYFPASSEPPARCFLFDPASNTWPEEGGQGDELLSLRQQRFETHAYISREDGTDPPASGLSFTMGEGRTCQNVTFVTTFSGPGAASPAPYNKVVCLVDGEHEYDHTVADEHSVEVVGYVHSGLHTGAGGVTSFVVGECTDVLIRVTTTAGASDPVTWSLDDGGQHGPWTFATQGVGVHEEASCMFDNVFTLTRPDLSVWQGSVEVAGFIHYHNTITVPNDEDWIVQGVVDPTTGLPASLDARISSGNMMERSHASIILRQLRISNQVAPIDPNGGELNSWWQPSSGGESGGAVRYEGGSSDPSQLVKLVFIDVVFDHNSAGQNACDYSDVYPADCIYWPIATGLGGAMFIDGRAAMRTADPQEINSECGIELTIQGCTFFANYAGIKGGAMHLFNVWPLVATVDDTDFIHNVAAYHAVWSIFWGHTGPLGETDGPDPRLVLSGATTVSMTDVYMDGGFSTKGIVTGSTPWWFAVLGGWATGGASVYDPDALWNLTMVRTTTTDFMTSENPLVSMASMPDIAERNVHFKFVDSSYTEVVSRDPRESYANGVSFFGCGLRHAQFTRATFARSGNFQPSTVGTGGVKLWNPATVSITTATLNSAPCHFLRSLLVIAGIRYAHGRVCTLRVVRQFCWRWFSDLHGQIRAARP